MLCACREAFFRFLICCCCFSFSSESSGRPFGPFVARLSPDGSALPSWRPFRSGEGSRLDEEPQERKERQNRQHRQVPKSSSIFAADK